jgi:SnoaL-like domain
MASEELKSNDEAQIRQLIDNWAKALRGKDVDGLMANYAPDLVLFNLAPPLQYNGVDACRNIWEEWLPAFQGPVGYEIHDLSITAGAERGLLPQPDSNQWNQGQRRNRYLGARDRLLPQDRRHVDGHT